MYPPVRYVSHVPKNRRKEDIVTMAIQNAEDLFVSMLSHLHASEGRLQRVCEEMSKVAENDNVKEALEVRGFLTKQAVSSIEECFRILGRQPSEPSTRFEEVWLENVRNVLKEIESPVLKGMYIIHKIRELQNLHVAEYRGLVAMAYLAENYPVATLLARNLADKVEFIDRTDELIREIGKGVITARILRRVA